MKGKGIIGLAIAGLLFFAMFAAMAMPAEAKTYYTAPSGHQAVRYNFLDIPNSLQPYISVVEYDLTYNRGNGYGVRLYLTGLGMEKGKDQLWAKHFAWYVRANQEWALEGRSENSVMKEIQWHCKGGIMAMADEYYYDDLDWWAKILFGK